MSRESDQFRIEPGPAAYANGGRPNPHHGTTLRNERRDERLHVRVQFPFEVNFDGTFYTGHDISVGGLSTVEHPPLNIGESAQCEIDILCHGFRAIIPATVCMLGTRSNDQGGRFEFTHMGESECSILRRLIQAHLAGTHLTFEQLSAHEDPQTVRDRVKKTVQLPNPTPSLARFGVALAVIVALYLILGTALYEHLFVVKPDFAAVTAPEIRIHAPTDGVLSAHNLSSSDAVERDQLLSEVHDPEVDAQLTLAEATLSYNERLLENMREGLKSNGGDTASIISAGPDAGAAPVLAKLSPLELRARIKELETTYAFAKAKRNALRARKVAGTIYAPCDCVVYSIRSGVGGYWVQKGELIARLIRNDPKDVKVEALVHLNKISGIEPNERAEVVLPTTGETRPARVVSIQLEGEKSERAGFPEWARQDMSHGTVILAMEEPLPATLVGHPIDVRFIDTDSPAGSAVASVFQTMRTLVNSFATRLSNVIGTAKTQRASG
jgi:multidrug resistance efflux pump